MDWCEAAGLNYVLGLASTATLRRHIAALETSTEARFKAASSGDKVRRFREFYDGADSRSRVLRIIARVEAGPLGTDTRFIVTNLRQGTGRGLHEGLYCQRGQAKNDVKAGRRTSPPTGPRAPRRWPTSSVCSCTQGPIGCCGVFVP